MSQFERRSLHDLVTYGPQRLLRERIVAGEDPTVRDAHGSTLLHRAAATGDAHLVEWLLAETAIDPAARNHNGAIAAECTPRGDPSCDPGGRAPMAPTARTTRASGRGQLNAHDSIRAYHAGKRELGEDVLDELLHIPARLGRHAAADHAAVQRAHPGESVVDVPTPYVICRRLFAAITLTERDRFVDLGCAAGRVVLYGGVVSPAQFVGIELIAERAAIAREAAQRLGLESVVINTRRRARSRLRDGHRLLSVSPFQRGDGGKGSSRACTERHDAVR